MPRWNPIHRNLDGCRSAVCPTPETKRYRIKVSQRQGASDLGLPRKIGYQKPGAEGGTQSQEDVKGEKREANRVEWIYRGNREEG